ncbi:MAG TPA: DUF2752 domain-containing protein [Bryobacteraceae bacterium]|nr:DUF2752 domain-containing protein [Bryobacteraceae bacterium]
MNRILQAASAAGLAGLAVYDPHTPSRIIVCGFYWLWGLPCPLCGMTRALSLLLHGDVSAGIAMHPMSPIVLALLIHGAACGRFICMRMGIALVFSMILFGIARILWIVT